MQIEVLQVSLICVALSAGAALAHTGATGVVKQRMEMMGDIAAQMKTIARVLNGQDQFNPSPVATSAKRIAEHAEMFEEMFPEGTTSSPSEALPEIWINWDEFEQQADAMKSSALALATAAETAGGPLDIKKPFRQLGMSCKSCHQDFRQKK